MPHRILTLEQAAAFLHLGTEDLRRLVRRDEVPFDDKGGRLTFRQQALESWASARLLGFDPPELERFHKASSRAHDLSAEHAILTELMPASHLEPALEAKTKASVVREMVALAEKTGLLYDGEGLTETLIERERLGSTALAGGVALLHPQHHEPYLFEDSFVVLGRSTQPIPFGASDGETTDLFFLVCCQDEQIHLHVLARICMACYNTPLLLQLREATDDTEMHALMRAAEETLVRGL